MKSFTKQLCLVTAACLTLAGAAIPAGAQSAAGTGSITGVLTDSTGALVPNTPVIVTDTDTGVTRSLQTTSDGAFNAPFLLPGHYEVVLGGGAFGKVDRKNLLLTVGETLTLNQVLSAASVSTEVVVEAEPTILDTDKTEVSQTLDEKLVANLPVATRNFNAFVLLTPNVTQDGGSGLISFHGISGLYNQDYVDGANNNQMLFSEARGRASGAPYVYSIDAIKEFQAETATFGVEFGQAAGGVINAITKSGTNQLHGDIFYYLRYPALNALDPYSKYQALHNNGNSFLLTQPIHQQQQFGGSVGGPIIKDRLFGFFTYDGFRRVGRVLYSDSNIISTTPTGAYTASTTLTPAQCPVVGTPGYTVDGAVATTGITAAQCLSGINFLLQVGNIAPGDAPPSRFSKQNLFFPKLDWHINSKNDAFVDYNFDDFDSTYGYSPANTFTNSSPSTNGPTSYHERYAVGGLTTQIGASSVNRILFQYGRDLETAGSNASGPSIATGVVTFGQPNALPRVAEPDEHRTQITDIYEFTRGKHTLKFGGDANLVHEVMINLFQGGGVYGYSDSTNTAAAQDYLLDAFAGQAGDTDPYAGFHYNTFVQTVDQINTVAGTQGKDDFWMKMFDGFAADSWKLAPNFTLEAGVRYDIQLTPSTPYPNNNYAPLSTKYSQQIKNVTDRIQPRIGFSWQPYVGTVVRGGYGIYSALNQGSTYYADRVENGVVQINYNYSGCESSVGPTPVTSKTANRCTTVPSTTTSLKAPNVPFPVTGPSLANALYPVGGTAPAVSGPALSGAQSFHGLDPNFVPPLAHEASLSVEQALPGKLSLQLGYVGTRALRLPVFVDANLVGQTPHGIRTYDIVNAAGGLVNQITVPVYLQSDRINQSLVSYNTGFSVANTWYNALAMTARRPFANGLEVIANYTWARATDTGQVGGANGTFYGGDVPLDPNNIRGENGPSDTDIRNRFTLAFVYQPKLFESNKIMKAAVDGFQFAGTEIASGGQPIYLGVSGSIFAGSTNATSYGADSGPYGGAISSSSGAATTGRPLQIGRNSISGPGFNDFDLRVSRDIPLFHQYKLQLSADAFNLLNHTIITSVNSTYSNYLNAGATTGSAAAGNLRSCPVTAVPTGSTLQGCYAPYNGTGLSAFNTVTGTNNQLYNSRQMEFKAKLVF
jgi:hypothetical protein